MRTRAYEEGSLPSRCVRVRVHHVLKNDEEENENERRKGRQREREIERERRGGGKARESQRLASRVIAVGANAFAFFALLAAASGYLLYHYKCNEMLRDVTGSARAKHALLYNPSSRLIAGEIETPRREFARASSCEVDAGTVARHDARRRERAACQVAVERIKSRRKVPL